MVLCTLNAVACADLTSPSENGDQADAWTERWKAANTLFTHEGIVRLTSSDENINFEFHPKELGDGTYAPFVVDIVTEDADGFRGDFVINTPKCADETLSCRNEIAASESLAVDVYRFNLDDLNDEQFSLSYIADGVCTELGDCVLEDHLGAFSTYKPATIREETKFSTVLRGGNSHGVEKIEVPYKEAILTELLSTKDLVRLIVSTESAPTIELSVHKFTEDVFQ